MKEIIVDAFAVVTFVMTIAIILCLVCNGAIRDRVYKTIEKHGLLTFILTIALISMAPGIFILVLVLNDFKEAYGRFEAVCIV